MEDNAHSAVKTTREGNSYPVVKRWSQNNAGFQSLGFPRDMISIVRASVKEKNPAEGIVRGIAEREGISIIVTAGYTTMPAIRVMKVVRGPDPVDMGSSIAVMVGTDHCQWICKRKGGVMGSGDGRMKGNLVIIDMVSVVDLVTKVG